MGNCTLTIYILIWVSLCPFQSSVRHSIKTNNPSPRYCWSLLHFRACYESIFICCTFSVLSFHLLSVIFKLFCQRIFPVHLSTYYLYLLAIQPPLAIPAVGRQFGIFFEVFVFLFRFVSWIITMWIESSSTFAACHKIRAINHCSSLNIQKISRIKLFIEVQEAVGSSVSVRISDLIESHAVVFTVSDKQVNFVEE